MSFKDLEPKAQAPSSQPQPRSEIRSKTGATMRPVLRSPAEAAAPEKESSRGKNPPVDKGITPVSPAAKPAASIEPAVRTSEGVDPGWPRTRVLGTGLGSAQSIVGGVPQRAPESAPGRGPKGAKPGRDNKRDGGRSQRTLVTGTVKRHPDGFGFLIPDDATMPDIYVSRQYMAGVMSNDRVEVEVFRSRPHDRAPGASSGAERLFGEVKRIVSRAHARIIGRFLPVDRRYGVIQDDGRGWGMDLRIATEDSKGAQDGDWVAIEITDYASNERPLSGRVVKILGDVEDPMNDIVRVIHEKGIPDQFSFPTQREAAALGTTVQEKDKAEREDLRGLPLITIDGATARDFDDAIYTEAAERGFRLIVAIADVSSYVKPSSSIDEDAYARGTSTYFPNFVVPMLPEELSNELCSLKPDVDRLCFACEMQLDFQGVVTKYRFFEGIMRSSARVTYGEAQEVVDGDGGERLAAIRGVKENILRSADLAKILMAKRFREGSLDLEIPETQVVVDSSGETIDVVRSERLFAHRLIEELMLVTNICTARFFDDNRIHGIYRIHQEPDPDNIKTLERMMWNMLGPGGKGKSLQGDGLQKKLTKALQLAATLPGGQVLNTLTLRAMNQAKYSAQNVGHFGLGFAHYSHFTSPIRRYPDLIAHRLIKAVLYPRYRNQGMEIDELESAATHLSACEQRSVKAERAVISIKKARFIRRYLGETLDGSITSVAKFGIFVTLREFEVDGLVKLEALGPDRWVYDEQSMRLYGRRTGRVFKLGDELRVVVQSSDIGTGKIDFGLEEEDAQVEEALVVLGDEFEIEELPANEGESPRDGRSKGPKAISASRDRTQDRKGNKRGKPGRKDPAGDRPQAGGRPHGKPGKNSRRGRQNGRRK